MKVKRMNRHAKMSGAILAFGIAIATTLLAGCGGHGGPSSPLPVASVAPVAPSDDWTTFAHDFRRSGYQPQVTGISAATVSNLKLAWTANLHDQADSSPLAYHGMIVVASEFGNVQAFSAGTGAPLWHTAIGGSVEMTPTIDGDTLFVGNRFADSTGNPVPSQYYALDLTSGTVKWKITTNGLTHGSPVATGGRLYFGTSGGDPPQCLQGGVTAVDESTGSTIWHWYVDPNPNEGGSVWSPISFDGTRLYFGTGNTCEGPITTADGAVSLTLDGKIAWNYTEDSFSQGDDDTGGGVLLSNNRATVVNKDGFLISVAEGDGFLGWHNHLGAVDGAGMFSTPATDGSTIIVGAGYTQLPTSTSPGQCRVVAVNFQGTVLWSQTFASPMYGYAAINNGVAFITADHTLEAVNVRTGKVLWQYTSPNRFRASPVVVPSGVYAVDRGGIVYAFKLPE
jgi:hypothetical protein